MSGSRLLPEQEELLCRLVEAVDRIKPDRRPFYYKKNMTTSRDTAILMHRGWLEDSPPVFMGDLDALADEGFIRRKLLGHGFRFELTGKAFAHYESRLYPDDVDPSTKVAWKPDTHETSHDSRGHVAGLGDGD